MSVAYCEPPSTPQMKSALAYPKAARTSNPRELRRLAGELNRLADGLPQTWASIESDERQVLYRLAMGRRPTAKGQGFPRLGPSVVQSFVVTLWDFIVHRDDLIGYFVAVSTLSKAILAELSRDRWVEAMNDANFVSAVAQGEVDFAQGKMVAVGPSDL